MLYEEPSLAAGKSGMAVIHLPYKRFEFFDRAIDKMAVTAGEYEVWYGTRSDLNLKSNKNKMFLILKQSSG